MGARQRKAGSIVIKRGRRPGARAVAYRAIPRKTRRYVIRIGCTVETLQMARFACRRQSCVLPVAVAGRTLLSRVSARQREAAPTVTEQCRRPCCRTVAGGAILLESRCNMIWIRCSIETRKVARDARRRQACVLPVVVAGRA